MVDFKEKERYGFQDLLEIMEILRGEDGCPWDREQTHKSIRRNFIEEVYEACEAIDNDDPVLLCEELGDVLQQVVFHAQIETEKGGFTLLENESVAVPELGICFAGAADVIFGQPDIEGLWAEGLYRVLLVHEPDYALEVTDVPLQLSGHSHGGQVYLPLIGAPHVPLGAQTYLRGRYDKADGGVVYVNRGIGMSILPYRFGSVPELTIVEIQ